MGLLYIFSNSSSISESSLLYFSLTSGFNGGALGMLLVSILLRISLRIFSPNDSLNLANTFSTCSSVRLSKRDCNSSASSGEIAGLVSLFPTSSSSCCCFSSFIIPDPADGIGIRLSFSNAEPIIERRNASSLLSSPEVVVSAGGGVGFFFFNASILEATDEEDFLPVILSISSKSSALPNMFSPISVKSLTPSSGERIPKSLLYLSFSCSCLVNLLRNPLGLEVS
mmetsp:Transcript_3618/g.4967  ORF Transcript_3618/g.4967 Transcript_3618/m.4967 type:complete len:226 (-) Transcript_3618:403-1080(-)